MWKICITFLFLLYCSLFIFAQNFLQKHAKILIDAKRNKNHNYHNRKTFKGDPLEGLNWKDIRIINGFDNADVAVLVMSSWGKGGTYYHNRVIPASRTWMRLLAHVFVIIEDNPLARLEFRHCDERSDHNFTSFKCPHEPTVVLASRCTEESSNLSGNFCCKIEELIRFLVYSRPELYRTIKYAFVGDDDYYYRVDRIMVWLSYLERANVSHIPLLSSGFTGYDYRRDRFKDCTEVMTYGWYGMNMFNKAALEKMGKISQDFGFTKQCASWGIAQDIGLGVVAWMLGLSMVNLPGVEQIHSEPHGDRAEDYRYIADKLVFHHTYHSQNDNPRPCDWSHWPDSMRRNQVDVVGCGSFEHPAPNHHHGLSSYQLWTYFAVHGTDELTLPPGFWRSSPSTVPSPIIFPLLGYNRTRHSKQHDILQRWSTYRKKDCENFDAV